jgi:HD-GYP domain-containing protein (c-di-GMP phosphodiesterase class II)
VTLNIILEQVVTQLHVDAAMLLLLEPHSQILEFAAGRGFTTEAIRQTRLRLNEDYPGRAARERRMLTVRCPDETQPMSKRSALLQSEHFSTYYAVPLIAKGQVKGVLELFQHNIGTPDAEWVGFLEALAMQAAIAIDNANLFDDLQQANTDLALAYDATLEGWVHALDLRDNETEGHTQRVTEATVRLARNMGFSAAELVHVRRGALLHDIGKMAIPDKILLKPGPLTDEEWEIMRRHPVYAYDWLAPIAFLRPSLDIPYCHHERWDGSGYPRGLRGEAIPLLARIFAVVDVWDALRSDRPYRRRWPEAEVRDYIQSQAGTQFDPQIVAQFLQADLTSDVMLCLNGEYRQPGMAAPDPGAGYDASTIPEVGSQEDGTMLSYCCNRTSQPGRF